MMFVPNPSAALRVLLPMSDERSLEAKVAPPSVVHTSLQGGAGAEGEGDAAGLRTSDMLVQRLPATVDGQHTVYRQRSVIAEKVLCSLAAFDAAPGASKQAWAKGDVDRIPQPALCSTHIHNSRAPHSRGQAARKVRGIGVAFLEGHAVQSGLGGQRGDDLGPR